MLQSDASDKSSSNEDDSGLQELQSEGEMTPTASSSLEDRNFTLKDLNEKIIRLLDNLTLDNIEDISKELLAYFDSLDKIKVIVRIMFEKAVSGEKNASMYAKLFKHMSAKRRDQMKQEANLPFFRKLFLRMCQSEFETDKSKNSGIEANLLQIVKEPSEEKRNALRMKLVNSLQLLRMRSLRVCRFLGELYVVGALNTAIIGVCIKCLLERAREEDLECLCVLMKIVGKALEEKMESTGKVDIMEYFDKMDDIVNKGKTSPDIGIMWKEVLLLKSNGWVPIGGPTAEGGNKNIQPEESNMIVHSGNPTIDQFSLPKNNLESIPLVEEKENNAGTIEDLKNFLPNIDTSSDDIATITYEKGQWSPSNPLGKKKYGGPFLRSLQYSPLSMKNPELTVIADCVLPYDRDRIVSGKKIIPKFYSPLIKKNLKLEKQFGQNAASLDKSKETEAPGENISEIMDNVEEQKPEMEDEESIKLRKSTEEIVASLERNNCDEVALKIMKLQIFNEYHLKTVVNAIFEQAVNESGISDIFACLCSYLNNANFGWQAMKEGDPNDNLKKSLLECFQKEFKEISIQAVVIVLRLRGVICFFGELYKFGMITDPILVMGMKILLGGVDDYSVKMLCNLISQRKQIK